MSSDEIECAICMEEIVHPTPLKCNHLFCRACIKNWRKESPTCPLCRARFTLTNSEDLLPCPSAPIFVDTPPPREVEPTAPQMEPAPFWKKRICHSIFAAIVIIAIITTCILLTHTSPSPYKLDASGKKILTMEDKTVRVWFGEAYEQSIVIRSEDYQAGNFSSAEFSSDGSKIVSAHHDGEIRIWHGEAFQECRILTKRTGIPARHARFSPDMSQIISCQAPNLVLWYGESFEHHTVLDNHEERNNRLATPSHASFSPDGSQIVSAAYSGSDMFVWNIENYEPVGRIRLQNYGIKFAATYPSFSPDGLQIISAYVDSRDHAGVRIWYGQGFQQFKNKRVFSWFKFPKSTMFSPDGTQILVAYRFFWDETHIDILSTRDNSQIIEIKRKEHLNQATFSHDGSQIAFSTQHGKIFVLHGDNFQHLIELKLGGSDSTLTIKMIDFA